MMRIALLALVLVATLPACTQRQTAATPISGESASGRASPIAAGEIVAKLDRAIWIVFQAKDSAYWFGSDGQGVYRYDGKELTRFTTAQGLSSDNIRGIQEDGFGNIFVCCEPGGVSKFNGRTFTKLAALDSSKSEWKLSADDLWFPGGQDSGVVYRWDGTWLHRLEFPKTEAGDAHFAALPRSKFPNAKYSPYDVYTIFKDSKGHLWFGTATLGACRFDGRSFAWVGHGENGSFGVRSIVEDREGKFWLSNCVHRFAEDSNAAIESSSSRFRKERGVAIGADPYSTFMSAVRDKDGDFWLAILGGGVYRYDGTSWTHFPVLHEGKPIRVYAIYKDRNDGFWLGTQGHGAYKFNGGAFEKFEP